MKKQYFSFFTVGIIIGFLSCYLAQHFPYVKSEYEYDDKLTTQALGYEHIEGGVIVNAAIATKIAEAVWISLYGPDIIKYKPFRVHLTNENIWIVVGKIDTSPSWGMITVGGVPYIEIQKEDGKILKVSHSK